MLKENSIDHQLRATWQIVSKMYNEQAIKQDYTMAMGFVVLNIDYDNGTPSTALGPLMGMEATSLSRILKSMEDKDIIYREKNPDDGRGVLIKLTKFGKEKREQAKASVLRFNEAVRQNINEQDLESFFNVTETISNLIIENKIFSKNRKES
ncbi:MAG TPA: MarR family transcriptional regulator [Flavobacteriaceae bacterium]|jgi:DNA-binding MarR family transcriptional regulator|nr:MarR family transcriptional regulator [Flavobacteriaceae bacterium]HBS11146.1 MarR family transcriptional regulator [Flavobacteriaceae bacterium]